MNGNGSGYAVGSNYLGVNLSFTKFLFVSPARDDEATRARIRAAVSIVGRGFFNDFEAPDGGREAPPHETVQFFANEDTHGATGLAGARCAMQVSSKYRPRLVETEAELRRRLGEDARVDALEGTARMPQYTSAEMYAYAYKNAMCRGSGRLQRNVVILPIRKTREWWEKSALERHAYFYPHADGATGVRAKGHALVAEAGISTIYRRPYYNPEGAGRDGEWDFVTYFAYADEHMGVFEQILRALRDERQNPEWRFVEEGPEWRGRRVLKW